MKTKTTTKKPGKPGRKGGKARPAPITRAEQESPASGQPGAAMGADDGEDEGGPVFAEGFPGEGMVILENLAGLFARAEAEPGAAFRFDPARHPAWMADKRSREDDSAIALGEIEEAAAEIITRLRQWERGGAGRLAKWAGDALREIARQAGAR